MDEVDREEAARPERPMDVGAALTALEERREVMRAQALALAEQG